ncbi:hypothetical protein JKP88DRAFT_353396 [Tribonema minus]|uniref:Uncharacterized protein n=1 Tax=Tribonema minus TaxID=303371 RepID=A0A835Z6Z3_9STRA|nr:hypothetical protein JKP88DRAFT_353396 [Tribonema minus]
MAAMGAEPRQVDRVRAAHGFDTSAKQQRGMSMLSRGVPGRCQSSSGAVNRGGGEALVAGDAVGGDDCSDDDYSGSGDEYSIHSMEAGYADVNNGSRDSVVDMGEGSEASSNDAGGGAGGNASDSSDSAYVCSDSGAPVRGGARDESSVADGSALVP